MDKLKQLREQVKSVDSSIVRLLKDRFELTKEIQTLKQTQSLEVEDLDFEAQQNTLYKTQADEAHISDMLVVNIFNLIRAEVKKML
jgi:chorismate mutase